MQLTPNFTLSDGTYSVMKFPSGEIQVKLTDDFEELDDEAFENEIIIQGSILSSDHFFELAQLVDAIRRQFTPISIGLIMPYCAYSRQDRVCNEGEAFSLKVFTNLINSLGFDLIQTWDNHSDVSSALLNNSFNIPVDKLLTDVTAERYFDFFISPDAGANKKVQSCSKQSNVPMLRADKIRDTATGKILDTILYATPDELLGKRVLIIDDLCANGRTFTELAKAIHLIQPDCIIELYVTHGFFSKGIDPLIESGIHHIYTTGSVCTISHPNLTVLE